MQEELKALQKALGITFIFVTHDQGEALSMADRVAVFNEGRVQQIGTPEDIYRRPQSRFVADFVGSSNVLPPDIVEPITGERRWASLRPESVRVASAKGANEPMMGVVLGKSYLGAVVRLHVRVSGTELHAIVPSTDTTPAEGERVAVSFARDALHLMEPA